MKKIFLTLLIGLMTMVGFSQIVKVKVTKRQEFEHSNLISTPSAFENGSATYLNGGEVSGIYTFNLNTMIMSLEFFDKNNKKYHYEFKIKERYKSTNLVDVLVIFDNEPDMLFVLGNTIVDNSYVLITNEKVDDKIKGSFYPDCEVTVSK